MDPFNPINEILTCWQTVSDCLAVIQLFFDQYRIPIPQDIDYIFDAATRNLDEII